MLLVAGCWQRCFVWELKCWFNVTHIFPAILSRATGEFLVHAGLIYFFFSLISISARSYTVFHIVLKIYCIRYEYMDIDALYKHIRSRLVWAIVVDSKEKRPFATFFPTIRSTHSQRSEAFNARISLYPFSPKRNVMLWCSDTLMLGDEKQIDDASKNKHWIQIN